MENKLAKDDLSKELDPVNVFFKRNNRLKGNRNSLHTIDDATGRNAYKMERHSSVSGVDKPKNLNQTIDPTELFAQKKNPMTGRSGSMASGVRKSRESVQGSLRLMMAQK